MGKADYYAPGDHNAICDQCGFKYKMSKLKTQWDSLITCPTCFDYRNPQEFVKGVLDIQQVADNRSDSDPTFTAVALNLPLPPP